MGRGHALAHSVDANVAVSTAIPTPSTIEVILVQLQTGLFARTIRQTWIAGECAHAAEADKPVATAGNTWDARWWGLLFLLSLPLTCVGNRRQAAVYPQCGSESSGQSVQSAAGNAREECAGELIQVILVHWYSHPTLHLSAGCAAGRPSMQHRQSQHPGSNRSNDNKGWRPYLVRDSRR